MRTEARGPCEPCMKEPAHRTPEKAALLGSDNLSRGFSLANAMRVDDGQYGISEEGLQLFPAAPSDAPRDAVLSFFWDSRASPKTGVHCTVDSEPPAELALSHGGKVLATSHEVHGLASGTGNIQVARNILRLKVQDGPSGDKNTFICTAHNLLGSVSTTGQLQAESEWVMGEEKGLTCSGVVESVWRGLAGPKGWRQP